MSYIYLRERGEESSAECYSDIPAYVLSKLNLTAEKSSCKGSATESCPASPSGPTCGLSPAVRGAEKSMSSAEDSRAKIFPLPEKARESTGSEAVYGRNLQESLARYDPDSRSWRTRQCLLLGGLAECLETLPKSGMMRNGVLWELTMSEPRTRESECGFWRTPDAGAGGTISEEKMERFLSGGTRESGAAIQIRLCDQVRERRLWPTPKCQDSRAALRDRNKSNLGEVVHGGTLTPRMKTARLNPVWVEWLMGWPIGFTDLKPSATDKFRSWRQQHSEC